MTDKAMSPLRRRMIEDMTIRKLAPKTQQGYIRTVRDFAAFLGRSPDSVIEPCLKQRERVIIPNASHGMHRLNPATFKHIRCAVLVEALSATP